MRNLDRQPARCLVYLALVALACGSSPARVQPLATLTSTGAPIIETPTLVPTETPLPAETLQQAQDATFTPEPVALPTETLTPAIPPTDTPLPLPTEAIAPVNTPACECSVDAYNCDDALANVCYRHCLSIGAGDIHGLDGDGDGIACQGN